MTYPWHRVVLIPPPNFRPFRRGRVNYVLFPSVFSHHHHLVISSSDIIGETAIKEPDFRERGRHSKMFIEKCFCPNSQVCNVNGQVFLYSRNSAFLLRTLTSFVVTLV